MSAGKKPSQTHIAEAAAWVAHLHGTRRTTDSDRGLQLWLKDDAARARALEVANEVWDEVGSLQDAVIVRSLQSMPRQEKPRLQLKWAVAAALLLSLLGALWTMRDPKIVSGIGEQRTLVLEDGSRVLLNTASKLIVRYSDEARRVELETGEARFDVAKSPGRPFIVIADGREIKALGTSFLVRRDTRHMAITLIEGKVSIGAETLEPGQRLTFASGENVRIDAPQLEKVTAWERGEVVMDGMHLRDAVEEMNRYSEVALVVPDTRVAGLLISGVFHSGDSMRFANAVANTYRLKVVPGKRRIRIEGDPQTAY